MRGFCPACGGQTRACSLCVAPVVLDDNEHECLVCCKRWRAEQLMTVVAHATVSASKRPKL